MSRRPGHLALSAAGWFGFVAVMVWTMAFLASVVLPRTVDGPPRTSTARAVAVDLALLLLFALQHSVMARRQVKAWLARRIPAALERTTYVLATDVCLVLLLALWQPWDGQVWRVSGPAAIVALGTVRGRLAARVASTFAVDHLELIGLRQAGWARPRDGATTSRLTVGGLHAVVRHPLMTGLLLAFWATPRMGAAHLALRPRRDRVHRRGGRLRGARSSSRVRDVVRGVRLAGARGRARAAAPTHHGTSSR